MKEKSPKISVIVPVYNAERYLHSCIESIIAQTFSDFELLLINDGSKDNSGDICNKYVEKDSRIRVFHKENGGVSSARNVGLDNARGEWVAFVDSDDTLDINFIQKSLYNIPDFVDIVFLSWAKKKKGKVVYEKILPDVVYDSNNLHKAFCETDIVYMGIPWGRIYKMDVIKKYKIHFDISLPISEDRLFFYEYIIHSHGILLSSYIGYFFRITYNGLSSKKHSQKLNELRINKLNIAVKKIKENYELSPKEYFPFWFQQLIYLSLLMSASVKRIFNPFTRYILYKRIFYSHFDCQFYTEAKSEMREYIYEKIGTKFVLLLKNQFALYEIYNICNYIKMFR